jgi:hypothetical protein
MIETREFGSYNEAVSFAAKTPGASKPWRKNPTSARSLWAVSVINPQAKAAKYVRVKDWKKPFMMYDYVQNVTMFLPQPERQEVPKDMFEFA